MICDSCKIRRDSSLSATSKPAFAGMPPTDPAKEAAALAEWSSKTR